MRDWYLMSVSETSRQLKVQRDIGLRAKSVVKRRERYGWNLIPKSNNRPRWLLFFDRFKDILVLMLVAGAVVSVLFGRYGDAIIISLAVLLDASLSFAQVVRTEKTLEKLREQTRLTAMVIRDGKTKVILAGQIVVGDVIRLSAGEKVPADGRVIESRGLKVDESSLTGESKESDKTVGSMKKRTMISNRKNMIYMDTVVVAGSGKAIVTAVGTRTEIGKIAQVLKVSKSPPSPLSKQLQRTGVIIGGVIIATVFLLVGVSVWRGMDIVETTVTAVTLVVSAIPEDLTMILTIALAIGVARILRYKGAVKNLSSGETLGAATVICADKTGTLTYGKMKASYIDLMGEKIRAGATATDGMKRLLLVGLAVASDAHQVEGEEGKKYIGNATEKSALEFVERCGLRQNQLRRSWPQRDMISFSRQWMYRASLNDHPTQATRYIFVNGAPEILLAKSSERLRPNGEIKEISAKERYRMQQWVTRLAGTGNRLMGMAVKRNVYEAEIDHNSIQDLVFMGVLVIKDSVRKDVAKVIETAERAGVMVKIVTGDHLETTRRIAREVGITAGEEMVITSEEIQKLTDSELADMAESINVFARVTPLDKQRIIKALRAKGQVVAMTGDGVNDAVALKSADIGVAMGSGKDIAKEAADLILLDDNFKIIVRAIQEGRILRDNLQKVLGFLLATNAAEVAIFLVSLMMGIPLPLLPAQILWINLVTDGTSDIALALEPKERDIMKRKPVDPKGLLLGKKMAYHIVVTGLVVTAATMALYQYVLSASNSDLVYARTMAFTFLAIVSLLSVWSFRSLRESILKRGLWNNVWVPVSLVLSVGLHLLAVYVPQLQAFFHTTALSSEDWVLILLVAIVTIVVVDARKYIWRVMTPVGSRQSSPLVTVAARRTDSELV